MRHTEVLRSCTSPWDVHTLQAPLHTSSELSLLLLANLATQSRIQQEVLAAGGMKVLLQQAATQGVLELRKATVVCLNQLAEAPGIRQGRYVHL